jgi:hypothetical protein
MQYLAKCRCASSLFLINNSLKSIVTIYESWNLDW